MSKEQAARGHEVTVLTSDNGDHELPREEERDGYRLIRHREIARPFDNTIIPGVVKSLLSLVSEYDVLHIHSHMYFCSNVAAVVSEVSNIPTVVTNHGLVSQTAPVWLQKGFNPTVGRLTFEAADRILCYTETDKKRLRDRGLRSDIVVIPNGIDCDRFSPHAVETQEQLLFVGRLKEGKGPQYVVEAFSEIVESYPALDLYIVGDGPLLDSLVAKTVESNRCISVPCPTNRPMAVSA